MELLLELVAGPRLLHQLGLSADLDLAAFLHELVLQLLLLIGCHL